MSTEKLLQQPPLAPRIPGLMPVIGQLHIKPLENMSSSLEQLPSFRETRERLKNERHLGIVLRQAEDYALQEFPTYGNPNVFDNPKLHGVLTVGNYQGVEQTSEEYGQLLRAKSDRQKVARAVVLDIITDPEAALELSSEQRILLKYGLPMQDLIDDMHLQWHDEVIRGPHADAIRTKIEEPGFVDQLVGSHSDYLYGLFRQDDAGTITFVPYARVFPKELTQFASLIDSMIADMTPLAEAGSPEAQAHIAVHRQLQKLLTLDGTVAEQEAESKRLETIWQVVADANNPAITSQILYPIETYGAGALVNLEYNLLFKQPEYDEINQACDDTKERMLTFFRNNPTFATMPSLQGSLDVLVPTNASVYTRFISGTSLGFRSAASNLPNREEVRLGHDRKDSHMVNGSKINFDYTTFEQRADIARGLLHHVFGQDKAEEVFGNPRQRIPLLLSRFVAGHEDAHNLLERIDTEAMLSKQTYIDLEEAKSDLASMAVCFGPGFLSTGEQTELAKAIFAEELRGLSRWAEAATDRTHLNGNIILVQLLLGSGIVSKEQEGWTFHATEDKLNSLQQAAQRVFLAIAKPYEATNPQVARDEAEAFQERYTDSPSPALIELIHDAGILSDEAYTKAISR